MSYVRRVTRSVVTLDRSRLRGWSAVRRATVVVAALLLGTAWVSPQAGGLAAIAALYVGLQDRAADPMRYTLSVMVGETVLMAAVIFIAGIAPGQWIVAVLLVASAVLAGLTASHDKAISRMFADVIVVEAFLGLSPLSASAGLQIGIAVLIAGLVQAVGTWWASGVVTDLPERRPIGAALEAVAAHVDDAVAREKRGTGEASEAALAQAEEMLARSDLSHDRRRAMRAIIAMGEALRDEASAVRTRQAFDVTPVADAAVTHALQVASKILRQCAAKLTSPAVTVNPVPKLTSTLPAALPQQVTTRLPSVLSAPTESFDDLLAEARRIMKDPAQPPAARAIAKRSVRLAARTETLLAMGAPQSREVRVHFSSQLGLRDTEFDGSDIRSGVRLGAAAALGLVVARILGIPHGSWVAATAVGLLRPDHRALTTDTLARSLGTAVGALAVIPLVAVTSSAAGVEVIVVAILALAVFMVTSANEGLFIVAMTIFVVFVQAVVGEDPLQVAEARVVAVLIGCGLAVTLLLLVPLRQGRKLRPDLADYATATAKWLDGVALEADHQDFPKPKKRRRKMRRARTTAQHHLDIRKIEPLGKGLPVWLSHAIFHGIHDCERAGTAAEAALRQGDDGGGHAVELGAQAAAELRAVADLLRRHEVALSAGDAELELMALTPQTPAEELLQFAYREAYATRLTTAQKLR